jgi:hypothetical protein
MPEGACHVFAEASTFTDESHRLVFELPEEAGVGCHARGGRHPQ